MEAEHRSEMAALNVKAEALAARRTMLRTQEDALSEAPRTGGGTAFTIMLTPDGSQGGEPPSNSMQPPAGKTTAPKPLPAAAATSTKPTLPTRGRSLGPTVRVALRSCEW